ncbi:MAG: hypothetical protein H0V14_08130 [Chitinophagaceae bacterium]|jgi:antitoxin component of RelBE/YafQ-DinJ toxin-antitoxin module|nr:hypothetical protein [Chitinophagaceae bacterium]
MKIKLTLNIDDKILEKAVKFASRKNITLSSVVENYLAELSTKNISQQKEPPRRKTITQRIRNLTRPIQISDAEIKKQWGRYLKGKYGKI